MAIKNAQGRISYLCFTTAQWNAKPSVVLNNGEFGFEKTTNDTKMKIGDGIRTWAELPYVTYNSEIVQIASGGALDSDGNAFDFGSTGIEAYNFAISSYMAHDVVDSLTSTSMNALSANQGRVLKSLIDSLTTRYNTIVNAVENTYGFGNG